MMFLFVLKFLPPDNIGYTEDSLIANEIYEELTKQGLKVFYSYKNCQGIEYDSQILSALSRSKMLLVISTKTEYLESAWVQSEWRRWLNFIKWEEKKKNSLILYTPNSDIELPSILLKKKIQSFYSELSVINNIVKSINEQKEKIKEKKDNFSSEIDEGLVENKEQTKEKNKVKFKKMIVPSNQKKSKFRYKLTINKIEKIISYLLLGLGTVLTIFATIPFLFYLGLICFGITFILQINKATYNNLDIDFNIIRGLIFEGIMILLTFSLQSRLGLTTKQILKFTIILNSIFVLLISIESFCAYKQNDGLLRFMVPLYLLILFVHLCFIISSSFTNSVLLSFLILDIYLSVVVTYYFSILSIAEKDEFVFIDGLKVTFVLVLFGAILLFATGLTYFGWPWYFLLIEFGCSAFLLGLIGFIIYCNS